VAKPFLAALFYLLVSLPVPAGDMRLFVRPWADLEPFVRVGADPYPLSAETAQRRILEEARVLLSAMVYGYSFTYTPSDAVRAVPETFQLTPSAEIAWGADRVRVVESDVEDVRLYARVSFTLSDFEARRRSSWDSSAVAMATGSGEGDLFKGYTDKIVALRNAIESAIKEHLRTRILNKPREVRGEVVLWEDPRTIVRAGKYVTTAKVRLRITEIIPYRIF
jgi:hypothetical protein